MKQSIYLLSVILWIPISAFGLDIGSISNAVQMIHEILGAEHSCSEFMGYAISENHWTPEEVSEILLCAQSILKEEDDAYSVYRRENAIEMIGTYGATNALAGLALLIESESGHVQESAAHSYIALTKADPLKTDAIKKAMAKSKGHMDAFSDCMYRYVSSHLLYSNGDASLQRNLLRLVLDQSQNEDVSYSFLDEILCREIPKWRASPQRAANAEKMIREHPEDVRLVAFFENVRSNALESARAATSEGSSTNDVPAKGSCEKVPTKSTFDPWADLLEDLSEKEPWTPPPGTERPY